MSTKPLIYGHRERKSMKQITVIDASSDIKNKLPKEYRNMKVRFFQYSLDAFYYKSDDISILADCEYEGGDNCYPQELLYEETVEELFNSNKWSMFIVFDKRKEDKDE